MALFVINIPNLLVQATHLGFIAGTELHALRFQYPNAGQALHALVLAVADHAQQYKLNVSQAAPR